MRRTRIVWFALGAATCTFAVLLAQLLVPAAEESETYLQVFDRPIRESEFGDEAAMTANAGDFLRGCKVTEFFLKQGQGVDSIGYSLVPAKNLSSAASFCVTSNGPDRGYEVRVLNLTEGEINAL